MFRVCRSLRVGAQAKTAGVERLLLVRPSVSTAKQVKLPNTSPWEFAVGYNLLSTLDTCFGSSKDCTHILRQKESPKNSELFTSECSRWYVIRGTWNLLSSTNSSSPQHISLPSEHSMMSLILGGLQKKTRQGSLLIFIQHLLIQTCLS